MRPRPHPTVILTSRDPSPERQPTLPLSSYLHLRVRSELGSHASGLRPQPPHACGPAGACLAPSLSLFLCGEPAPCVFSVCSGLPAPAQWLVQPAWPWHDEGVSADSTGDFRAEPWRGSGFPLSQKTSGSATLLAVRSQASVSSWPQFFYL